MKRISAIRRELADFFKFIKPYRGRWQKGIKILDKEKDIIYYNEREWRYCPLLDDYKVLLGATEYNRKTKDDLNVQLKSKLIPFSADDIKFIVISKKNEVNDFALEIKKMNLRPEQENGLISKIISFEEIEEDY